MPYKKGQFTYYGKQINNTYVKKLLRKFFDSYRGRLVPHNANFDFKVLIYELYMDHALDTEGMLLGLQTMFRLFDDTKVMHYLCTNNTVRNELSLKVATQEFMGNYGVESDEIKDIRKLPPTKLLSYNIDDTAATYHLYEQCLEGLVRDEQEDVYTTLFKPLIRQICHTELVGIPLDIERVYEIRELFKKEIKEKLAIIHAQPSIQEYIEAKKEEALEYENSDESKRVNPITIDHPHIQKITFNPNSNSQLGEYLHDWVGLPVLERSKKTKDPSVGNDVLKALVNHTDLAEVKLVLTSCMDFLEVSKILSTFIEAFITNSFKKNDGVYFWSKNPKEARFC